MLMMNVEDFDDVCVQIFERLRVYEGLVDIMLEMREVVESVQGNSSDRVQLSLQGIRQIAVEDRMEKVMHTAKLLFQHLSSKDEEEAVVFEARVQRVETLVESVTNQLIEATGIRGETDRYERAVTQWRSEVERQYERMKRSDAVKMEVKRLEEQAL